MLKTRNELGRYAPSARKAEAAAAGLKTYDPGQPCKNGHYAHRFISNNGCAECLKIQSRKYHKKNRDRRLECMRELAKQNPEDNARRSLVWYYKNPDKAKAMRAAQYRADPERWKKAVQQWASENPDRVTVYRRNRKARLKAGGGCLTIEDWQEIKTRYSHRCACCKKHDNESPLTMDHIWPLSKGGRHHKSNIQPLCRSCNARKGSKMEVLPHG